MNHAKRKAARRRYYAKFKARKKYDQDEDYRNEVNKKGLKE
tara:strand:+ start:518 stop:640 length:123 start_codon:yes stop_codon:yes gene_type:complete